MSTCIVDIDKDARTRLENGGCGGGCGQVASARLQSGGCVGRSTKDPRAHLRSGGWQWGVWYRPKPSRSLGELRVQWPVRRRAEGVCGSTKPLMLVWRA